MKKIPQFEQGLRPFVDANFRLKLNMLVDAVNSQSEDIGATLEGFDEDDGFERVLLYIGDHNDLPVGRAKSYEWQEVIPNPGNLGSYTFTGRTNATLFDETNLIPFGEAINGVEFQSSTLGYSFTRPIIVGAVVPAIIYTGPDPLDSDIIKPTVVFSSSNHERYCWGLITGFSAGTYNFTECYANGDAIDPSDNPVSSTCINAFYGPAYTTDVVPNGSVVPIFTLPSVAGGMTVYAFSMALRTEPVTPMYGDQMVTAPSTLPVPYPPTTGSGVPIGLAGAWIQVFERDDPSNPGFRMQEIYHLPPTVSDPLRTFDTAELAIIDGGNPAGGGSGSATLSNKMVQSDIMGHMLIASDGGVNNLIAGDHIVFNGAGQSLTIKHSIQGSTVESTNYGIATIVGGVEFQFPVIERDNLGHITISGSPDTIGMKGDDWVQITNVAGVAQFSHIGPENDGALMGPDPLLYFSAGSIVITSVNPYIDSKGHVNDSESNVDTLSLTAGDGIEFTETGANEVTISTTPTTAGTPTSIGDVVTNVTISYGTNTVVITRTKNPIMVTTRSDGVVTAVTLGSGTDTTSTIATEDCT